MIKSKEWNWNVLSDDGRKIWLEPSIYTFYLVERWKKMGMKDFLDLGCGLGRHTILFAQNDFNTCAFDLSHDAVVETKKYAEREHLKIDALEGDMLKLPYKDNSFDAILCFNVISHTDTKGFKKILKEIKRVLRINGEVYLTLCSKETWGFKETDWPMVDENTKIRMDDGPEKGVPHFYVDYELVKEMFKDFKIEKIFQVIDYYFDNDNLKKSYHYHLLIKKEK